MTYTIYRCATHTGIRGEVVAQYSNRGHALAKLRGLRRRAWLYRSEAIYSLVTS